MTVLAPHQQDRTTPEGGRGRGVSERRCLVTGDRGTKEGLIRFVLDPAERVVPDLAERLPGRGLWVTASRAALDEAVRKNMFAKAAKTRAVVDPDLVSHVEQLLARRCMELLGLARGAGLIVAGQPQVEAEGKAGALAYILVAEDAGSGAADVARLAPLVRGFARATIGQALGREQAVYIGVKPHGLADTLRAELARWQGLRKGDHQGEA